FQMMPGPGQAPGSSPGAMAPPGPLAMGSTAPQPVPATMSSGQMVTGASSSGGKGVWIALAALVLVGGGGTAAYFATRASDTGNHAAGGGGGGGDEVVPDDEPAEAVVHGDDDGDDDTDVVAVTGDVPGDDDPDDVVDPADLEDLAELGIDPDKLDEVDAKLDELDRRLTAAGQRLSGTTGGTATGGNTTGGTATGGTATGGAAKVTLDGPRPLARPSGWDPKAFDVLGYLPTALDAARKVWADATLVRIDADGVRPTGLAELTLSDDFYARYWFKSDVAGKRPADLPAGMKYEATCNLQIVVNAAGLTMLPMTGWDCDELAAPMPKCNMKQMWDKAIKLGAPGGNAVAEVSYMANIVSKKIRWFYTVGDFSEQIPDGC
ncbi:MAG: hypothetical protein KC464_24345, partial [Myxococcales bacterium]|nr:hypothetical protein [Myxococcales bacterium]